MKRFSTIATALRPVPLSKARDEVSASFDRFCLAAGIETLGTMMASDAEAASQAIARESAGRHSG